MSVERITKRYDLWNHAGFWAAMLVAALALTAAFAWRLALWPDAFGSTRQWAATLLISFAAIAAMLMGLAWLTLTAHNAWPIVKREFLSLFYSPIAYVVIGLFTLGCTAMFWVTFTPGGPATLRPVFDGVVWLLVLLVPAVSMRMMAEEYRANTIETMLTSPVSDVEVILGKWLGAMGFMVALLATMAAHLVVLEWYADPDYGPIFTGFLGLVLVSGLYLAIGTFASSTTQNQIIAYLIAFGINCLLTVVLYMLAHQLRTVGTGLVSAVYFLNINRQYEDFAKGLLDVTNFAYFGSGMFLFLFLAVKLLELRKWR